MKRRNFFKTAALSGAALSVTPLSACESQKSTSIQEVDLDFELNEATVEDLQNKMQAGELSAVGLLDMYLQRIEDIDKNGPGLRSIIEINPDAREIAKKLDEERQNGKVRGPLHGIPVVIKDNIDTGDKMMTTAGSLAMEGHYAEKDAFIVGKLRDAGAVLLGKTNLSEWANIRSTKSSSGWSGRGGQVRNPYCLDRSPCGSSSGTGAAVAANLATLGIGTETDGSVVCPSGTNGLVGIKPGLGVWSRSGIIPISHSQDTAGPMARTVRDAALLLGALHALDEKDPAFRSSPHEINDYTPFLKIDGLKGKRIGVVCELLGFNSDVDDLINKALEDLQKAGATIVEDISLEGRREWGEAEWQVLLYELKHDLNKYLEEHPKAPVRNLAEIIEFNKANADLEMPWFEQEIFIMAQEKGDLNESEYKEALKTAKELSQKAIDKALQEHQLDALLAATNGPAWSIDWVNGDHFTGGSSGPAAVSGYPNITVPAGFVHGLPIGISFFSTAWQEGKLIEMAYAYEQLTKHRQSPKFINSLLNT